MLPIIQNRYNVFCNAGLALRHLNLPSKAELLALSRLEFLLRLSFLSK